MTGMILSKKALSTFSLIFINFLFVVNALSAAPWSTETVVKEKYSQNFSSRALALDTHGHPHIVCGGTSLFYAYHDGSKWHIVTVDSLPGVGGCASIAMDKSGRAHIGYYDLTNKNLKYATNVSGSWITVIVDNSGKIGGYLSIALDTSSKVHLSYYDDINGDLRYATNVSGAWVTTTVDNNGDVGGIYLHIGRHIGQGAYQLL